MELSPGQMGEIADRPLVCVALAFAGGIALAAAHPAALAVLAVGSAVGTVGWILTRRRAVLGATLVGLFAAAGALALTAHQLRSGMDVARLLEGGQTVVGTVAGPAHYADGRWAFVLAAEQHEQGSQAQLLTGRAYVRLKSSRVVERGQRWRLVGRLHAPRSQRNPGGRSEAARLASLGVGAVLDVGGDQLAEPLGQGDLGLVSRHAYHAQQQALAVLGRFVTGPYPDLSAQVASSVIFGVHAAPVPMEISDAFRRAGTIHLLVVSGAMVSMVFGFVFLPGALGAGWRRLQTERQMGWPLSGRGRIRQWPGMTAAALAIGVVIYYAVLTEGGQAVARAAVMGSLVGLAFILRRVPGVVREHGLNLDHYTLLAVAGLAILVMQPTALSQPGFQLSFTAVWALIFLTPKVERLIPGVPRWLALGVAGTLAAQLATFPILAWHYGQVPIGGLGANLLAVPLAAAVLTAGMATCLLGVTVPWLALVPGWVTGIATRWLIWVSSAFSSIPVASWEVARPSWLAIIAWYAAMIALGWWLARVAARPHRTGG